MSAAILEEQVLAKPYFENEGLIVAVDGGRPVGFAHAAFGPTDNQAHLSRQLGVTCLILVDGRCSQQGIADELLARSEAYLRGHGAQVLYGGGIHPLDGFYLGLYGGSELPGVLDSDAAAQRLFREHGYRDVDRTLVLQRELAGFHAPIDRVQLQIRRQSVVERFLDPPAGTWWEACTWGWLDRTRYELRWRGSSAVVARVTTWPMQPLAAGWGVNAAGLVQMEVEPAERRKGVGTFLVGEVLRQLQSQGVSLVEVQTMHHNQAALGFYKKLGFRQVDQAAVLRNGGA